MMTMLSSLCALAFILTSTDSAWVNAVQRINFLNCTVTQETKYGIRGLNVYCVHKNFYSVPKHIPNNTLKLDLSLNKIKYLYNNSFCELRLLRELSLRRNYIYGMEAGTFYGLSNLKSLYLSHNRLELENSTYHPGLFKPMIRLNDLDLWKNSRNYLSQDFPCDAITSLSELNSLSIDGRQNMTFCPGMKKLTKLRILSMGEVEAIGFCNLVNIGENFFDHIPMISCVKLLNCRLQTVHPKAFSKLSALENLDISHNEELGFNGLGNVLCGLSHSRNRTLKILGASRLRSPYGIGTTVRTSDIVCLKSLPLRQIAIGNNAIEQFETTSIAQCFPSTLEELSLDGNRLLSNRILSELSNLPRLEKISYRLSQMNLISPTFDFKLSSATRELRLSGGNIRYWNSPAPFMQNLTDLRMSRSYATRISPNFFDKGVNIVTLILQNNLLGLSRSGFGARMFRRMSSLETLTLASNVLEKLDYDTFIHQKRMRLLLLSHNRLTSWEPTVSHMAGLQLLDLSKNYITTISPEARQEFEARGKHFTLNLYKNTLDCSCDNIEFLQWVQKEPINFANMNRYKCRCDLNDSGLCKFSDLDWIVKRLQLQCQSYWAFTLVGSLGIILASAAVVGATILRYQWKLRYLYYLSKTKYTGSVNSVGTFSRHAYLSYADEDVDFVINRLIPELEDSRGLKLCVRHREFLPGVAIAENITNWIHSTKRTIVIMSMDFLGNKWCMFEMNIARMDNMYRGRDVILLLHYRPVPQNEIPPEVRSLEELDQYMTFNYFAENPSAEFWNRLHDAIVSD